MWPKQTKEKILVACGRCCCVCHRFCGVKIELHHIIPESEGGKTDMDNCIALCFDCHADAGHYNTKHPKGTKYSPSELRMHRDKWFSAMKEFLSRELEEKYSDHIEEVYEGRVVLLKGFVWSETFPGPPNYSSLVTDSNETYWMLVLPKPITLMVSSIEYGNTFEVSDIKKLQLMVSGDFYNNNKDIVLKDVSVKGRLFLSVTGHHHGQALFEVIELVEKYA